MKYLIFCFILLMNFIAAGQYRLSGRVTDSGNPIPYAKVKIKSIDAYATTNEDGLFELNEIPEGSHEIEVFSYGFDLLVDIITVPAINPISFDLASKKQQIDEVVVSGTLKEVSKKESTVNVEVYSPTFFKKNPTPNIYEALQNVNGVRPQLNCNICNTGDIHINGLEGPYTMILIDGMPIVSSLSSVYGLSGIPNSLVERIEIVKGPASTLYGSEAIGGVINIITKKAQSAPIVAADVHTTSWFETNVDLAARFNIGAKITVLTGINYFNYDLKKDDNNDGFTDVTLQDRISIFQKWNIKRKDYRLFSIAGRYFYEDRWGGEMNWNSNFRGGDSIYGESIYTSRWELLGKYQLPFKERVFISGSFNKHTQNSFYGSTSFMADQMIAFGQIHWDKEIGVNNILVGISARYTIYDDDSPATENSDTLNPKNFPDKNLLPGIFVQDEIKLASNHKLLLGVRYDYNTHHGSIFTPRLGYKWSINDNNTLRFNSGTGYRIVNIFTEDHAALTGARDVIIADNIDPEQSYNANLNFNSTIATKKGQLVRVDFTGFYTYFTNRIVADYDEDPNKIYYSNLDDHAISQGISLKLDLEVIRNLKINVGGTLMDIGIYEDGKKQQQILTENFHGTWSVSYSFPKAGFTIDYTGNIYNPMRLPLLNEKDPRPEYSPWWSIQNIQLTYKKLKSWEIYAGVKNLLNWTPNKATPFLIARSNDPFDKQVSFDENGNALSTPNNPNGLTFDPSYVYAPNQGIRGFLGIRYTFK